MPKCKSCDAVIIWAETEKGTRIPLNIKPEKRFILTGDGSWGDTQVATMVDTYVSHFATCPDAGKFRKKQQV